MALTPLRCISASLAITLLSPALGEPAAASRSRRPDPHHARGTCSNANLAPTRGNLHLIRVATLCLINQQRVAHGMVRLRVSAALHTVAQRHSAELVAANFFADGLPPGRFARRGENIAAGTGRMATPTATVAEWMNSSEHRANILDPAYRMTGIGAVAAAPALLGFKGNGATYTQAFTTAH